MRVLLINADSAVAQSVELLLKSEELNVHTAPSGEEGIDLAKHYDSDIILLHDNLTDISAYKVLRRIRDAKIKTPIMVISDLKGVEDKVRFLAGGTDDYLTQPFHKDELVARIHAIVRRSHGHVDTIIRTGSLAVNIGTKTVSYDGQPISVTAKEYGILELLSLRQGATLSKAMFLDHIYGGMDEPEEKIIDVYIWKLRKKIEDAGGNPKLIKTIHGRGYVLNPHDDVPTTQFNNAATQHTEIHENRSRISMPPITHDVQELGNFHYNKTTGKAYVDGEDIKLTDQQALFLGFILEKPGEDISFKHLLTRRLQSTGAEPTQTNIVRHLNDLAQKLDAAKSDLQVTISGRHCRCQSRKISQQPDVKRTPIIFADAAGRVPPISKNGGPSHLNGIAGHGNSVQYCDKTKSLQLGSRRIPLQKDAHIHTARWIVNENAGQFEDIDDNKLHKLIAYLAEHYIPGYRVTPITARNHIISIQKLVRPSVRPVERRALRA